MNSNLTSYYALYPGILVAIFSISYHNLAIVTCKMEHWLLLFQIKWSSGWKELKGKLSKHFIASYQLLSKKKLNNKNPFTNRWKKCDKLYKSVPHINASYFTTLWEQSCRDSYNTIISPSLLLILGGNNCFLLDIIPFLFPVLLVILLYFWRLWPVPWAALISEPDSTPTEQPGYNPLVLTYQPTNKLPKKIITRNLHLLRDDHENRSLKSSFVLPLCTLCTS